MAKLFLNGKKFSPLLTRREKDMLQQRVDATNDASYLFYYFGGTNLDFMNKLDTSNVTNMKYMFYSNSNLKTVDLSNFDTSNVTNMQSMFSACSSLTSLNVSNFDTSNVTNMYSMFNSCNNLTTLDISNFNTDKVTNASQMISYCRQLKTLIIPDGFLRNVNDASNLVSGCFILETFDTTKLDLSNCTTSSSCFYNCKALNVIDLRFKTSKITNMEGMFSLGGTDNNLEQILGLDMYSCTKDTNLFYECEQLKELTVKNIRISIVISTNRIAVNLSRNSLLGVAKELWDNSGSSTAKTLTITNAHKTTLDGIYVKLVPITEEMRAEDPYIDNKKPFVECASTDEGAMTVSNYITVEKNWTITAS